MPKSYDFIIRNAKLFNGLGDPAINGDLAVSDGYIADIGNLNGAGADEEIDANGLALAPGFIDTHTHDDKAVSKGPMAAKISQGVTTIVTGNCGVSVAPLDWSRPRPALFDLMMRAPKDAFISFGDWFKHLETTGIAPNVVALVGHSNLRLMAMEDVGLKATQKEIDRMGELLDQALEDGVAGMSSGLVYGPAQATETSELVQLARRLAARGGIYTTHMRDEGDDIIDALNEAFTVGEEVPVLISHFKCLGKQNFGRSTETIAHLDKARSHMDVGLDAYPYAASSTELRADFAARSKRVLIAESRSEPQAVGRNLADLAAEWGIDEAVAIDRLSPALAVYFNMDENDVQAILTYPHTMIGSDGIPEGEKPHPRLWGTFARVIGHYARDVGLFPLEEAIRRMTSLAAQRFGLADRGVLKAGAVADLVLFDPATVVDTATFADPVSPAAGIETVWVAGVPVWQGKKATAARPGRVLKSKH